MKRKVCCLLLGFFILCSPAQMVFAAPVGPVVEAEEKKEEPQKPHEKEHPKPHEEKGPHELKKPHEEKKTPGPLGEEPAPPVVGEKPIPPHKKKEAEPVVKPELTGLPEREEIKEHGSDSQQSDSAVVEQSKPEENTIENTDTSLRQQIVEYALKFVGNPYKYGGTSLTDGADCSGFVQSVYAQFGYKLSRTSRDQAKTAGYADVALKEAELQQGDLIFYANSNGVVYHVAIYIGDGKVVHAANAKKGIIVSEYTYMKPYKARRVIE